MDLTGSGLSARDFAYAFPFHIACDSNLQVIGAGREITALAPTMQKGAPLHAHFHVEQDGEGAMTPALLHSLVRRSCVMRPVAGVTGLRLRGEWLSTEDGRLLFLGWPWTEELPAAGTPGSGIDAFPPHARALDPLALAHGTRAAPDAGGAGERDAVDAEVRRLSGILERGMADMERSVRRQAASHAVTRVLADGESLEFAAPRLLEAVCIHMGLSFGALWLVDTPTGELAHPVVWTAEYEDLDDLAARTRGLRLGPEAGFPGMAWARDRVIAMPESFAEDGDPRRAEAGRAALRAALCVPLRMAGGTIGVLEFLSRSAIDCDGELVEIFIAMGSQIGVFIERYQTQRHLRDVEARRASILDAALDCIITVDHEGRIIDFNRAAEAVLGHPRQCAVGADMAELIIPPEQRAAHREGMRHYLATGSAPVLGRRVEAEALHADGTRLPVELAIAPVFVGNSIYFTAYLRNISERRRSEAEILRLNRELEQRVQERTLELADTMRELEAFTYSVSHDLRAPLRAIAGFSRIVLEDCGGQLDPENRENLLEITRNAAQMGTLIDELLAFSRLGTQPLRQVPVAMRELVERSAKELGLLPEPAGIHLEIGEFPDCAGDPALLKQALVNLLGNAQKYSRPRQPARIEVGWDAGRDCYFVRDNGVGFDMRHADKLFGVFQRLHTDAEFEGSGVGLAIVHRIITRHGGSVHGEAEPDRGATFRFTLPRADETLDDD